MTYLAHEISTFNGKPIELFEFVGEYQSYHYTPIEIGHIQDTPNGVITFEAIPIRRGAMKVGTQDDDKLDLTVEIPANSQLALDYAFQVTPPTLKLNIYRIHRGDGELITYWTGFVENIKISGATAVLSTPSLLSAALDGSVPSAWFQSTCNFRLFDPDTCGVPREDYSFETLATVINGRVISIDGNDGKPDGFFKGGEILSLESGERRMILEHTAEEVVVTYPFAELVIGAPVEVTAGCDHDWAGDCATKFNNQLRCGCFGRWTPPDNPFTTGID